MIAKLCQTFMLKQMQFNRLYFIIVFTEAFSNNENIDGVVNH